MNVTRANYFQGKGRGKAKSKQKNDINFFQVVREGSKLKTDPENNSSNSNTSTTSEIQRISDTNTKYPGTSRSMFSRSKTCSGSGFETVTTHLGYDGPSAMEILCSEQSITSFDSIPFFPASRNVRFVESGEFINASCERSILHLPTNSLRSKTEHHLLDQENDSCVIDNNLVSTVGLSSYASSEENFHFFSDETSSKEILEMQNSENFSVSNQNYNILTHYITGRNGNQMEIENVPDKTAFLNNYGVIDFNSNYNFEISSSDDKEERGHSKNYVYKRYNYQNSTVSNESNTKNQGDNFFTFPDGDRPIATDMRLINEKLNQSNSNPTDNNEPIFRYPLPPKNNNKNKRSALKTSCQQDPIHSPDGDGFPPPNAGLSSHGKKARICEKGDGLKTPVSTSRRLTGLFTPLTEFSSLPRATDYFLTPTVDTTPLTTRDEISTPTTHSIKTPGPRKVSATEPDNYYIIALTEGRGAAVGEVGMACIDIKCPSIQLCQISDFQTYMKSLTKINIYNPSELIVPDTFLTPQNTSDLFKVVTQKFDNMKVVTVKRVYFNDQNGFDILKEIILPELSSLEITVQKKYYALAAVSALIKYVEYEHNIILPKNSIKVEFQCAKDVAYLDLETARRLELVTGNTSGTIADRCCLFAVLNKCRTFGGKRRLRTLILQPPSKLSVIMKRQDAVDFLVHDPIFLTGLQNMLSKLGDVEKLLWLCKKPPNFKREQKTCENLTNFILLLKKTVEDIPALRELLGDAQQDFFIQLRQSLLDQSMDMIKDFILSTIKQDAKPTKGYSASEIQRCFSIKEKVNELLDVARVTYSNLITLVQEEVDMLAETHGLPLKMTQSSDRGFHIMLSIPKNQIFNESSLPQKFIQNTL